jgi:flagellar basal-body rod modification protein FlgD
MTTVAANPAETIYASLGTRTDKKSTSLQDAEDRFLTLLTTQLKNQDPLNPLDNAQMTSQLAQISTVDGIEKLNTTLQKLLAGMDDSQAMQAASLVSRGVLVPGNSLALQQEGGIGGIELTSAADEVVVTIKDANGLVMRSINFGALDAGIHPFTWDGKTDGGAQAVPGSYRISVSAKRGAETATANALAFGMVQAVTRGSGGLSLDVGTLGAYTMADVKQIL